MEQAAKEAPDVPSGAMWSKWHAERQEMEWHVAYNDMKPVVSGLLQQLQNRAGDVGLRIVDVGCGTSALGIEILTELPCAEVILLDAVDELVQMLRSRYSADQRVHCVQADCRRLSEAGIDAHSVDVILDKGTLDALASQEDREAMLQGMFRLLRHQTGLVISVSFASAARLLWLRKEAAAAGLPLYMRALRAGKERRLLTVLGQDAIQLGKEDAETVNTVAHLLYAGPLRGEQYITFEDPRLPCSITVEQDANKTLGHGEDATGRFVWPAAQALSAYLCLNSQLVKGRRVVELGAGTGLTGLVAAMLGAEEVVLTDLPSAMPLLQKNIDANTRICGGRVRGQVLWWGSETAKELSPCDVVLACEVIYQHDEETASALVQTMQSLMATSGGACFMAYEFREGMLGDATFFDLVNAHFDVEVCSMDQLGYRDPMDEEGSRYLYIYRPKLA